MSSPVEPATDARLDPRLKARQARFFSDAVALLGRDVLQEIMAPQPDRSTMTSWAEVAAATAERAASVKAKVASAGLAEKWAELNEDDSPQLSARYRASVEVLSPGLEVTALSCTSTDGNTVPICFIRPAGDKVIPCIYYVHGGGMAAMSAMQGQFQEFGRLLARQGVAVCLPDFRNCLLGHESVPEVAEYPAGLNDCYSGLEWVNAPAQKAALHISEVCVAGESGGGNLALALGLRAVQFGSAEELMPAGIVSLCPYIAGSWPLEVTNEGILGISHIENSKYMPLDSGALPYSLSAFESQDPQVRS